MTQTVAASAVPPPLYLGCRHVGTANTERKKYRRLFTKEKGNETKRIIVKIRGSRRSARKERERTEGFCHIPEEVARQVRGLITEQPTPGHNVHCGRHCPSTS